jgi:hypothetical protein
MLLGSNSREKHVSWSVMNNQVTHTDKDINICDQSECLNFEGYTNCPQPIDREKDIIISQGPSLDK